MTQGQRNAPTHGALLIDFGAPEHGHRGQYNAALARIFPLERTWRGMVSLLSRKPVLVPMIEDSFFRFALGSLVRSLLGRRTAGIMMRPLPALRGTSLRLRTKRAILKVLRRLPGCSVLTLVPFPLEPELTTIAHGWIYDLQNWDLQLAPPEEADENASDLIATIRSQAGGRRTLCALGYQNLIKGFPRFVELYDSSTQIRQDMLFVFGGKVDPACGDEADRFKAAGGLAFNRFVSDKELFGLYAAADLVWCHYDASYDQTSGILGRALQLGVPVVVRHGSVAHRQCALFDHPHIAIDAASGPAEILQPIAPLDLNAARMRARQQAEASIAVLEQALGLSANAVLV